MRRLRAALAAAALLLASLLWTAPAGAADDEPPPPTQQQDELYLQAMRALAEGRADQATDLLMRFLEKEPQHAGAWLDLAISQCELGHGAEAERLFTEIEQRFSPPPGIVEVIGSYRERGCVPANGPQRRFSLSATRGYDTNVNQGAGSAFFSTGSGANYTEWTLTDEFLRRSDQFALVTADYSQNLNDDGLLGFAQARSRRHDNVHSQDTTSLMVGLEQQWRLGGWRGRATAALSALRLDNHYYQRQEQLQVRATPPLVLSERLDWSLTAALNHVTYPTRPNYNGSTLELGTSLAYHHRGVRLYTGAGAVTDHGQNGRLGGNRDGWYGNALLYTIFNDRFSGQLGWTRQVWRGSELYSEHVIDVVRHQDTRQLSAALTMELGASQSLQLEWRSIRNQENIPLFQYNSRTVQLTWRWDNF
nr:tetratricopeptide repeat protein [uncultured Duganella sp.]